MSEKPQEKKAPEVRINVPLDAETHKRLKIKTIEEDVDLKALVNRLLKAALDQNLCIG
jgi:hypothetical protein